jgi:sporulation protein YlmC with PRC-barrel domain
MDDRHTRSGKRATPDDTPQVAALRDLDDFQVAEGFPDPRGWDVLGSDGVKVGKVHDLIVDTAAMRTRYLDVELDRKAIGARDDRDVLIPVGTARLDDTDDRVILGSLSGAQLASLPPFDHHEHRLPSCRARRPGSACASPQYPR